MFGCFCFKVTCFVFCFSRTCSHCGAEHLWDKLARSWQMLEEYLNESGELKWTFAQALLMLWWDRFLSWTSLLSFYSSTPSPQVGLMGKRGHGRQCWEGQTQVLSAMTLIPCFPSPCNHLAPYLWCLRSLSLGDPWPRPLVKHVTGQADERVCIPLKHLSW